MTDRIAPLIALLERGQDSPLLRFSLGTEHLARDEHAAAAEHLRQAVTQDPGYSAAWKLLGRALAGLGRAGDAKDAWRRGIAAAEEKGDRQAAKEMAVFLRRLEKSTGR